MNMLMLIVMILLPIPFVWAPVPRRCRVDPVALAAARRQLTWIALAMAAITLAYKTSLGWLGAGAVDGRFQPLIPTLFFVWVPWGMLLRYFMLLASDSRDGVGRQRSAGLRPRRVQGAVRAAWLVVSVASLAGLVIVGRAALETANWNAGLLLLLVPVWLMLGYRVARGTGNGEPETFPGSRRDPQLVEAYDRRRAITAWSTLALFASTAAFHNLLAIAVVWSPSAVPFGLFLASLGLLALVVLVHWLLRRRVDARIEALLTDGLPG